MVFQQLSMLFTLSMLQQSSKALTPEITFQGTKIRNGSSHVYQFTCATNVRFWGCTVELFVKNETNVKLRLFEKTCYNRYSICKPEICSCSDGCNEFKWNLTNQVNMDNASIECEGRLQQYDLFFKANAHIMVYRTGFINLGSTVDLINSDFTSVITSSTSSPYLEKESSDNKAILIAILCFVSLIPIVLILLILRCILQHFYESEGGSNDQLTLFCCPLSHNRSIAINRSAKTRGNVIELDTNINPNNRKHTIYRHRVDTLKTNPKKRGQTTQSQIRSVNTSEIITKPNEHDKIKTMMRPQSSYINETELNIDSNDLGQAIQQQIDVKEDQIKLQRSASDVHKQNVFGANGTFCMNAESKERNAKEVKVNLERSASDATHKNVFGANGPLCMNAESIDRKRSKNKIKLTPPVRFGNIGNQSKDISRCSISSDSTDGNTSMENLIRTGTGC